MTTRTAFDVTMPQLGETVSEGTVISWLAETGAEIGAGDPLLEVSTDKVDTELPSPVTGLLTEILAAAGDTVAVGSVIARIEIDGEASPPNPDAPATAEPAAPAPPTAPAPAIPPPTVATPASARDRRRISPVARRIAAERNIDEASLVGTGPGGAIQKRDVPATSAADVPHPATEPMTPQPSSSLTAQVRFDAAAINASGSDHALAAFVIRALVDVLRSEAQTHPSLAAFVEPQLRYVHARSGHGVALPDAAGLRMSALSARLAEPSDDLLEAAVTILDSSDQGCALFGVASSALVVGIGPRQTIPTATPSGTGMAIVFTDVVELTVTVDVTQVTIQALTALANQLEIVLETRDWSTEV